MALTGPQLRDLRNALVNAFNYDSFQEMMLFELDKKLENIAGSGPLNSVVFKVINAAEMEGWTLDLLRAARIANPGNANLHQIAEMLALSSTRELPPAALNFEKIVRDGAPFLDPSAFRSKLGRIEQQVCSIEFNGVGHGSGVLVGPDYVLTNHHVVSKATKDTKLACRFDFAASADGKVINQGHTVDVAPDIVDWSPPSANDPNLTKGDPSDDELDYALLRLVREIGNEPAGSGNNPDAPARGWTQLAPNALNINDPLLILQHPQNPVSWKLEPLKLTMGKTLDMAGGGRRLRHDANTLPGSSGSPCFSVTLDFVALHHAGGDSRYAKADYNQAIPAAKIIDRMTRQGVTPFWKAPPPQ
ncbi:MAG: effector-associated domain EAD1-containing protein [Vicinamibacterales bacterium]